MSKISIRKRKRQMRDKIIDEWIGGIYFLNMILRNCLLTVSAVLLIVIATVTLHIAQVYAAQAMYVLGNGVTLPVEKELTQILRNSFGYIHEIAALITFLSLNIYDVYCYWNHLKFESTKIEN